MSYLSALQRTGSTEELLGDHGELSHGIAFL